MLKTRTLHLAGPDGDEPLTISELPALVADRAARAALTAINAPLDGGVVSLALEHMPAVLKLAGRGMELLAPFVQASRPVRHWSNVLIAQQAALALHVDFLIGRPSIAIPVTMQADRITRGPGADAMVNFCSPPVAAVLHSGRASYRELETVLSTEDVYNLVELLNVEAVREWRALQQTA
ncbi:hypothetical protein KEM14_gp43 [Xanthomonas virus phiXaf18]|uniref:Uncharacterized protein n=3 Tax=root TaxID=1 RepID=A0A3G1GLG7_9CAUD|nr:hypothetical protein KEM13_gp55 [Xanthomonas phage KPhi1]YP_010052667.1 hypothetical protein KEM14_gp43 [Xanthomonas virus phiXaf18]UGL62924.1 hypothetical protein [Xanthomonas phage MYK3]UUW40433.1 hypothetical protein [Xanthomonas phage BsXeu269p/3]APQ41934.1 hypothetical protein K1pha_55 [Xanthomonas phage KPhi1]QFR59593.1 hypothetical protein phiXaf18_43 [Xanthomonas virus phiXaf18]